MKTSMIGGLALLVAGAQAVVLVAARNGVAAPLVPDPPTPPGVAAAQEALAAVGTPYRWGATGADRGGGGGGYDCSGLIWRSFAAQGIWLPRVSYEQARAGVAIPRKAIALKPGDLLTFSRVPGGPVEHVGLYVGGGNFVHSSGWDRAVVVSSLAPGDPRGRWWWRRWVGVRRVT